MPSRRGHQVRRLSVALLVGVMVTVALAWLAMFLPTGSQWYGPAATEQLGLAKTSDAARIWQIDRGRNAWHVVVRYWHMQISGRSIMMSSEDFEGRRFDPATLPGVFRPESLDELHMMAWYHRTGWPFGAWSCSVHWKTQIRNEDIIYTVRGGVQLPRDAGFNPRALPLMPAWPGFVGDVLVWGGVWWMIGWGVRASRLRWRAKRDRCPCCGYSRSGLAPGSRCPECGAVPKEPERADATTQSSR